MQPVFSNAGNKPAFPVRPARVLKFVILSALVGFITAQNPALYTLANGGQHSGDVTRYDLATLQGTLIASLGGTNGGGLACGPDGKLYAAITAGPAQIIRLNTDGTGQAVILDFASTPGLSSNSGPQNLTFGPDGALYFVTIFPGSVWRLAPGSTIPTQVIPPFAQVAYGVAFLTAPPYAGHLLASGGITGKVVRVAPPFASPQAPIDFITGATLPEGLVVDSAGNLFVGTGVNPATSIKKYAPDGTFLSTVFNNVGDVGDLAFDSAGNLYASISVPNLVRIAPDGTPTFFGDPSGNPALAGVAVCSLAPSPPPPTGTIQVTTNLPSAAFSISGPANFNGSGTSASFSNAPPGPYTIKYAPVSGYITPPSETKTLSGGTTLPFIGSYKLPPPSITSLSPRSGIQGQTIVAFTVAGANFQPDATLSISGSGITINVRRVMKNEVTATIFISHDAMLGTRDIIVTNPDMQSTVFSASFTVLAGEFQIFSGTPKDFATEPSIALDPNNPLHVVVGFNELVNYSGSNPVAKCSWKESRDGGLTWAYGSLDFPNYQPNGDPWVRFGLKGELYYSCMAVADLGLFLERRAVFVATSFDGLAVHLDPVNVATSINKKDTEFEDHPSLGVLRSPITGGSRAVVCWVEAIKNPAITISSLNLAYSDDGKKWSTLHVPIASGVGSTFPSTCVLSGTESQLFITWSQNNTLWYRESVDGVTWSPAKEIAAVGQLLPVLDCASPCSPVSTTALAFSLPYASFVPGTKPQIVWQMSANGAGHVLIGSSQTGVPFGNATTETFLPSVGQCVVLGGTYVAVSGLYRYALWDLTSEPIQQTFTSGILLNPHNGYFGGDSYGRRIGDYTGVDCSVTSAWAAWTDTRNGVPEIWGVRYPITR